MNILHCHKYFNVILRYNWTRENSLQKGCWAIVSEDSKGHVSFPRPRCVQTLFVTANDKLPTRRWDFLLALLVQSLRTRRPDEPIFCESWRFPKIKHIRASLLHPITRHNSSRLEIAGFLLLTRRVRRCRNVDPNWLRKREKKKLHKKKEREKIYESMVVNIKNRRKKRRMVKSKGLTERRTSGSGGNNGLKGYVYGTNFHFSSFHRFSFSFPLFSVFSCSISFCPDLFPGWQKQTFWDPVGRVSGLSCYKLEF